MLLKIKPEKFDNAFNKYLINISSIIQSTTKFATNKFYNFLSDVDIISFFIKPFDKTDFQNIIFPLNSLQAVC